jgi:hypothetical protein
MVKRSSKKKTGGTASTVSKSKIVERIAALMHDQPGITVQRNRRLPPVGGKGIKREIDVLLTASVAGYAVQMAIECKNEATAIGSPMIDAFVGKLQYVGIPLRLYCPISFGEHGILDNFLTCWVSMK